MDISLSLFAPKNLVSRDGFGSPIQRQPAHLHTRAESDAYLRDCSRFPRRRRSVPILSGHTFAHRWRSLPRVRRHRAIKPQYSSRNRGCLCITMDQFTCASLSHTHYWYEVYRVMTTYGRSGINRCGCQPCSWSAEQGKIALHKSHARRWRVVKSLIFFCPSVPSIETPHPLLV